MVPPLLSRSETGPWMPVLRLSLVRAVGQLLPPARSDSAPRCTLGHRGRCYREHVDPESAMPLTAFTRPEGADADSLERARRGELAGFELLMHEHEARVFSIALRFTGRRADAEELTQDVFIQLHASLAQIADAVHLRRWLLRTVTHRCLNRLRDQRRRPQLVPIEMLTESIEPAAPEGGADPIASSRLRRLLLDLAPEARAVMLLRFQEDLDPAEIAILLEMPVNTVKSHLRRSLDWLRTQCSGDVHGS